jgi:hypothetical protein
MSFSILLFLSAFSFSSLSHGSLPPTWEIDEEKVLARFTLTPPKLGSREEEADYQELEALQVGRPNSDCSEAVKQKWPDTQNLFGAVSPALLNAREVELVKPWGDRLIRQISGVSEGPKKSFGRVRPYNRFPDRVVPCGFLPEKQDEEHRLKGSSFPSSHSTMGKVLGHFLGVIFPEKKESFRAQGERIAYLRKRTGVHHPSDTAAGQFLGQLIIDDLQQDDEFQRALQELIQAARSQRP